MKKLSTLIIYCSLLLCTIIFFSLNSCSKKDEGTKTEPISLSSEKSQYAPYEIVTILASENIFTLKSFTAKINNIEILIGSNENIASLVLPNLPNGNYDLSFTLNEKKYIVPIKVSSLSTILSADEYFNEIQLGINQNITNLNSQITQLEQNSTNPSEYANLKNDVIQFTNLLSDFTISYNNLSSNEKQEFAKTMAANKASIDEYNDLTVALNSSIAPLKPGQSVQDYETGVEASKVAFVSSVIYTVGHIPFILAGAQLATTLNPWVSGGAILATGIITGSFLINVANTASAAATLIGKSLKPFEFIEQTSQTIYNSGVETVSDIQAKYRSLINSDGSNGSNGSTINTIVEKYNIFKDKYNGFISELPDIFRPSYIMTSLKNTYNSTTRSIYNQYVSITNVSNPNVTLQQLNQADGSIKIKATTSSTTDQTFTYNVNYTNGNFTTSLTINVSATVKPGIDSIQIYRNYLMSGSWLVKKYLYDDATGITHYGNGSDDKIIRFHQNDSISIYTTDYIFYDATNYSLNTVSCVNGNGYCYGNEIYNPNVFSANISWVHPYATPWFSSGGCINLVLNQSYYKRDVYCNLSEPNHYKEFIEFIKQ